MAKKKTAKVLLSERLEAYLGQKASRELIEEVDKELLKELTPGAPMPKIADMIVHRLVKSALSGKEWALQAVYDRMEGKAPIGVQAKDDGRALEDKLDGITTQHLNTLASSVTGKGEADDQAAHPAGRLPPARGNDLYQDQPGDSQEGAGKPAVAEALAAGGHE